MKSTPLTLAIIMTNCAYVELDQPVERDVSAPEFAPAPTLEWVSTNAEVRLTRTQCATSLDRLDVTYQLVFHEDVPTAVLLEELNLWLRGADINLGDCLTRPTIVAVVDCDLDIDAGAEALVLSIRAVDENGTQLWSCMENCETGELYDEGTLTVEIDGQELGCHLQRNEL